MRKCFWWVVALSWFALPLVASPFPKPRPNPWNDSYRHISGMQHYRSWGTYNVHDPALIKSNGRYYMYSTDAIYRENRNEALEHQVPIGFIQMRSSKDLVHWQFEGWALPEIPQEAKNWVLSHSNNRGATNMWAPFPVKHENTYRIYYTVSAFGLQTSYIGLIESSSPLGPWVLKGEVVKTKRGDRMNAIDASVITDKKTGRMWMHYGSFFGGLYVLELNPVTGLALTPGDQGVKTAGRANFRKDNIEAPEIMYHPELKQYFLFVSYDPLMTTYNLRVGRSNHPEGPFFDFFGKDMRDTTNNYPILTHPYRFENHPGWAGVAHNGVIADDEGNFFMAHQGRLSPENHQMVLHVRQIKWLPNGWPVVSPQRYAGNAPSKFGKKDMVGVWEIIRISDVKTDRELEYGQILWGQNQLRQTEVNTSSRVTFLNNGQLKHGSVQGRWRFRKENQLSLHLQKETISDLIVFVGQDWENATETLLFTGLDKQGKSVWGKKVK